MKGIFQKIIIFIGIFSVLLLSGCENRILVGSKAFVVQTPWERQAELAKIHYWKFSGSFSIQQTNHRSAIASFIWWQSDRAYRISILSALDLYRVDIYKTRDIVKLWKNGTLSLTAKTPEALLQEAMSWSLPVSELQWWIKGMPAPQQPGEFYARYDQYGHLIRLKQAGWMLYFSGYRRQYDSPDFPRRIILVRPGVYVKIIVKDRLLMMEKYYAPETTG